MTVLFVVLFGTMLAGLWPAYRLGYAIGMRDALDDLNVELNKFRTPDACVLAGRLADRIGSRAR